MLLWLTVQNAKKIANSIAAQIKMDRPQTPGSFIKIVKASLIQSKWI